MAEYESSFDTSAIHDNKGRTSTDYGIFQINSQWNCDPEDGRSTRNGCGHPCSDFLNTDLSDDVACIKQLKREHNGFRFSYAYRARCRRVTSRYLSEC
ncbi:LYSC-like protein [Mya arenaria]|uniref:lysozyme n=2 Tax=Mya arenaria TaxID=6604 RepID=A0ABY7F6D6_MYAAR|nr:LYSC-like protein [Mya arenaria]